jgi:uncharacterized protein (TIGR00369 family)
MARTGRFVYDGQPDHILARMQLWEVVDDDGTAALEVDAAPELCNPHGSPHASVLAGLIDCCAAGAAVRATGSELLAGADLNVRFLGAVKVGPARAAATVLKAGRTSVVVQVDVVDAGAGRRPVAVATMSFTRLDAPAQ